MTAAHRFADVIDQAVCTSVDTDLFFPEVGQAEQARAAKRVCQPCPVRTACLQAALELGERGVWGGTTERERSPLVRGSRPAAWTNSRSVA